MSNMPKLTAGAYYLCEKGSMTGEQRDNPALLKWDIVFLDPDGQGDYYISRWEDDCAWSLNKFAEKDGCFLLGPLPDVSAKMLEPLCAEPSPNYLVMTLRSLARSLESAGPIDKLKRDIFDADNDVLALNLAATFIETLQGFNGMKLTRIPGKDPYDLSRLQQG